MSNFKKIVSLVLSLVIISSLCVVASAADTDTNIKLTSSFDNDGKYLQVTISTTKAVAGLMGKLTYDADAVKLIPANTVFCVKDSPANTDNTVADSLKCNADSVDLVLVGDVAVGTTDWATFQFEVLKTDNVEFVLDNVTACNVDDQDVSVTISNKSMNVSVEALATLGAQIRQATSTETIHDMRFGSKLVREDTGTSEYIMVNGTSYKAKSCGYLVALTSKITNNSVVEAMTVGSADTDVKNKPATNCLLRLDAYFIYTVVVTGITSNDTSTQISVRPYVAYDDGGTLKYSYGEQVSKSVSDVVSVSYN